MNFNLASYSLSVGYILINSGTNVTIENVSTSP